MIKRSRIAGTLVVIGLLGASPRLMAMSESELTALYLDVVEHAVEVFEPLWGDDSGRVPDSGFFDFRKYGNWRDEEYESAITVPGNGMVAYCYAVLLTETDKTHFSANNISREVLRDHAIKAIRWLCLTSDYVEHPYPYPIAQTYKGSSHLLRNGHWYRAPGKRCEALGWFTLAVAKLRGELDPSTQQLVQTVLTGTALKADPGYVWTPGQGGNHDQVIQDYTSTAGAAFLWPQMKDRAVCQDLVRRFGIGMVATEHDPACHVMADGKPVCDWGSGWNLYPDYSSDHHGWCQLWYGNDKLFHARTMTQILSVLTHSSMPETFTYSGNGFDGVADWVKILTLPEAEPASIHGMEYDAYYGCGLLSYCYGSLIRKDPIAAAFEERAARLLQKHTRAVRMYDYHRNSWAKAASAFLMHKYAGPRAEPLSYDVVVQRLNGTWHYPWQQALIHRSGNKWTSFSWGSISSVSSGSLTSASTYRPIGFVVPARTAETQPEPLVYLHPDSLGGSTIVRDKAGKLIENRVPESIYHCERTDAGFSTVGRISDRALERYYGFHSFDNGPCILYVRFVGRQDGVLDWSGLPVYFYVRPGMTSPRRYYDAEGEQPLEKAATRRTSWWCVNDQLGLAACGGNGQVRIERSIGFNWARKDNYRDQCDGIFVSPVTKQSLVAGETAVNMAVVLYPGVTHASIQRSGFGAQSLILPVGWCGIVASELASPFKQCLAISHLYGPTTDAWLDLHCEEGAPVLSVPAIISQVTASLTVHLENMESMRETVELYLQVPDGSRVRAVREKPGRYALEPLDGATPHVRVRYSGTGAKAVLVHSTAAFNSKQIPATDFTEGKPVELALSGRTVLEMAGPDGSDTMGPAVEIRNVTVREDNRVAVEIEADDQSGIASVEMYDNGKTIGHRTEPPFIFTCRPSIGWHTYQAVATDASSARNPQGSSKRTIEIKPITAGKKIAVPAR